MTCSLALSWSNQSLKGQRIVIAGGSRGLGKAVAHVLVHLGAHIWLLARNEETLLHAQVELQSCCHSTEQQVEFTAVDLSDHEQVDAIFAAYSHDALPDALYCVAGGATKELGFFADTTSADLQSCFRNNWFSAANTAHALLQRWLQSPLKSSVCTPPRLRRIVFVSSAAAFVGLPGYGIYTSSKTAVRALADTLRQELLRYNTPHSANKYSVHCGFFSNFQSEAFIEEQKYKPDLTKRLEGTAGDIRKVLRSMPSAEHVAKHLVSRVEAGDFAICDNVVTRLLLSGMQGPTPKSGCGFVDCMLGCVSGVALPILRRLWDRECIKDGVDRKHEA